ncbi:RING-H2 finger protein [Melia azedarach]|uniref:RING-H2 finger protein n=1 Tax=Melia azedarach TaxID=155640 RepID=A0ACC1WS56_MELAZ|nr:RING-H2 finger protein [Melia azedarach]
MKEKQLQGIDMESSNLFQMLSSCSPSSSSPFAFIGISVLILIYVLILYLVMDFNEDNSTARVENCLSGLSLEEIQELPWFDCEVNFAANCAVCLDSVQKGDRYRIFPGCGHVFHAQCVDLWLLRRPTCPNCRSLFKAKASLDVV